MTSNSGTNQIKETRQVLEPSSKLLELTSGDWAPIPQKDPLIGYVIRSYWPGPSAPSAWEAARFSRAVYLYRESSSQWTFIAKYYSTKTGSSAVKYSERELDYLRQVRETGFESGEIRVIRPLGTWSGVLFLEYEEGLTLKDLIAVRQTFPGKLRAGLRGVARFLAKLHSAWQQPETSPDVERAIKDNLDYVEDLAQHGVLKTEARIAASLESMISEWARDPLMASFTPTLIHGDATTTNFVVLDDGSLVALDLERLKVADPAADLGRLAAEVFHSLREAGGDGTETESLLQVCFGAYREALPSQSQVEDVLNRTCFYQGTSLLRIARNGWIPRLERMSLVAQAMALLSQGSS